MINADLIHLECKCPNMITLPIIGAGKVAAGAAIVSVGASGLITPGKIQAAQFVHEHGGEVCPSNWKPGEKTLKPGLDLVGKIWG